MKNIVIIGCFTFLISLGSCQKNNFLDSESTASLNKTVTFADSANTMDFLAGLYVDNSFNFTMGSDNTGADFSKMTDEAEGRYPALGNFDKVFTQGTFNNSYYGSIANDWALFYKNIHNVNVFLEEVDNSPLSDALKVRVKAEARFIRAYHYSFLTKYFGGVPLVGDKVYSTADEADLIRSSYEDCVNYIVDELDAIANDLPLSYRGLDYGRITRGASLALKARVLLFAASPLYNGGSTATNPELIKLTAYPTYDKQRWEKARLASKAVMDLGLYSLNEDNSNPAKPGNGFYSVFIKRMNNEFILSVPMATGKEMEKAMNPYSRGGRNFYYYPTQELVDMFPMINGLPITDPASGYQASNPYLNRDPRFGATVIYNGSLYYLNSKKALSEVFTYVGAPDDGIVAVSSNKATITGYYTRKFCDELAAYTGGNNVDRSLPLIRYAEILLNYAEASNEMGNTVDAINALKLLRKRAGIVAGVNSLYGLPANPTLDELRSLIQNERAIELAFEHHRMWDIRRWKIGGKLDGKFVHGMQITKTGNNYSYKTIDIRTRYFKDIYYYFPIPKDDVTLNQALLQNPEY